jgi:Leucine-rich repeat (LRR) protein
MSNLKVLDLRYSGVKSSHLFKLSKLLMLEELNLDSCLVGDVGIAHLVDHDVCPNLKSLDLSDNDLTDAGMVKIAKFSKLVYLSLFYCNITNSGLRQLAGLEDLEVLNLDSRDITDEGLLVLRSLQKLKSLDIFSGRITDTGCGYISAIKSLGESGTEFRTQTIYRH